jgi:hypothetical protein
LKADILVPSTPLAKKLEATGLWNYGRWAKKSDGGRNTKLKGDKSRVNIVDEKLCGKDP